MMPQETTTQQVAAAVAAPSLTKDVHILPLGVEFDRAVLPFLPVDGRPPLLHAHHIHLVVPEGDGSTALAQKIDRTLRGVAPVERHELRPGGNHGRRQVEFQHILELLAKLVHRELRAGHRVHINLSSGTKILAFAAGLAGMAHLRPGLGSVYYVRPSGYSLSESEMEEHGPTKGMVDIQELTLLPLLLPPPISRRLLAFVRLKGEPLVEYRDLVGFLCDIAGSGYERPTPELQRSRRWNNAITTRMVRTLLEPMAQEKLVEIKGVGRRRAVRLTARGELYAALAALGPSDLRAPL